MRLHFRGMNGGFLGREEVGRGDAIKQFPAAGAELRFIERVMARGKSDGDKMIADVSFYERGGGDVSSSRRSRTTRTPDVSISLSIWHVAKDDLVGRSSKSRLLFATV